MMRAVHNAPRGWQAAYQGAPWELMAAGPDAFDCHGLIEAVWAKYGRLDLSLFRGDPVSDVPAVRHAEVAGRIAKAAGSKRFVEIERPEPLAIGVVYHKRFPVHAGLYAHGGKFVHACEERGRVCQDDLDPGNTGAGACVRHWYWPSDLNPKMSGEAIL